MGNFTEPAITRNSVSAFACAIVFVWAALGAVAEV